LLTLSVPTLLKRTVLTCICCLLAALSVSMCPAQEQHGFLPFEPNAPIPSDFLISFPAAYEAKLATIKARFPRQKQVERAYYRESTYYLRRILQSGKVLFNDSVSGYVNKVADQLLRHRPKLRKELKFFAVRSHVVNAFATEDGMVLVNVGLIAQLESEAELAFILAHEIAHYAKQHARDVFIQSRNSFTPSRSLRTHKGIEAVLLDQNLYSRGVEREADTWGTRLFISSGYNLQAAIRVFSLLQDTPQPFATDSLDYTQIWPVSEPIPADWLQVPASQTEPMAEASLSWSASPSHPAPESRKKAVRTMLEGLPTAGRPFSLVGEADFREVRRQCRYMSCRLLLAAGGYEYALLGLYKLAQDNDNPVEARQLHSMILYGWYGLSKYANAGRFFDIHSPFESLQKGARQFTWFTEQLSPLQLNSLCLHGLWNQLQTSDASPLDSAMFKDLVREYEEIYLLKGDSLNRAEILAEEDSTGLVKGLLEIPSFRELLGQNHTGREGEVSPRKKKRHPRDVWGADLHASEKGVVYVQPGYLRVDDRLLDPILFVSSEESRISLTHEVAGLSKQAHIPFTLLTTDSLQAQDIERFRDIMYAQDWLEFIAQHEQLTLVSPFHNELRDLTDRYGTSHFVWLDIYSFTRYRKGKALVMAAGFLLVPALPFSIYYVSTPRYDTALYLQVYDILNPQLRWQYPWVVRMQDRPDVIRAHLYDLISQFH